MEFELIYVIFYSFFFSDVVALYVLVFLRFIVGAGQGPLYPAISVILTNWVPKSERSRIGSLSFSGAQLGMVFSKMFDLQLFSKKSHGLNIMSS